MNYSSESFLHYGGFYGPPPTENGYHQNQVNGQVQGMQGSNAFPTSPMVSSTSLDAERDMDLRNGAGPTSAGGAGTQLPYVNYPICPTPTPAKTYAERPTLPGPFVLVPDGVHPLEAEQLLQVYVQAKKCNPSLEKKRDEERENLSHCRCCHCIVRGSVFANGSSPDCQPILVQENTPAPCKSNGVSAPSYPSGNYSKNVDFRTQQMPQTSQAPSNQMDYTPRQTQYQPPRYNNNFNGGKGRRHWGKRHGKGNQRGKVHGGKSRLFWSKDNERNNASSRSTTNGYSGDNDSQEDAKDLNERRNGGGYRSWELSVEGDYQGIKEEERSLHKRARKSRKQKRKKNREVYKSETPSPLPPPNHQDRQRFDEDMMFE